MKTKIKAYLKGTWFSLPIQLVLMHFKRHPFNLLFWFILFATIHGSLLNTFGARILFLYPEYLNKVNFVSTMLVGIGISMFIMSWNITTFIINSRQFRFLATTTQPFLKYCVNNSIIPLAFLLFYLIEAYRYNSTEELLNTSEIIVLSLGFITGFVITTILSFAYFFGADKTIYKYMPAKVKDALQKNKYQYASTRMNTRPKGTMRVDWFLTARLKIKRARYVGHYPYALIERIFKQHHFAAVLSIILAFTSLVIIGYYLDNKYFQIPAAASVAVLFAVLVAVGGAITYFLRSWTLLFVVFAFFILNTLYKKDILDPRNKAYGLNYIDKDSIPAYNKHNLFKIANKDSIQLDSLRIIKMLETWKQKQGVDKPNIFIVSVSGGGNRSATFTFHTLRLLDSMSQGNLMKQAVLMAGASGGMIGAAWYRELYRKQQNGDTINRFDKTYADAVGGDFLNAIFSSLVARDLLSPTRKFTYNGYQYNKDRGYAFEQKLNETTYGWLDHPIHSYQKDEDSANIPIAMLSSIVTRDGRKIVISASPSRYLMQRDKPQGYYKRIDPDVIDFQSFFAAQNAKDLRFLSALRMNATFPYILPSVWLPSQPIIDVMDAGFRDNTGVEMSLQWLLHFKEWVKENCNKVVILQIRDKPEGGWKDPYESSSFVDLFTQPALLTQSNLFRFQEYQQWNQWQWINQTFGTQLQRILFEYAPSEPKKGASLSFHLALRERKDIEQSLSIDYNLISFAKALRFLNK